MTETEQDLKEIIAMLPDATVEQLDRIGMEAETNLMFACFGRADREVTEPLVQLVNAVNAELKRRGLAIRPQDRK
jgi:hypothetical protein